jgi:hypothetical protein
MNGNGSQFPSEFLETIYSSVQKKQLGEHSKLKEAEVVKAYIKGDLKLAQEIHFKHLEKHLKKQYSIIKLEKVIERK